jgi:hypothetical protein
MENVYGTFGAAAQHKTLKVWLRCSNVESDGEVKCGNSVNLFLPVGPKIAHQVLRNSKTPNCDMIEQYHINMSTIVTTYGQYSNMTNFPVLTLCTCIR